MAATLELLHASTRKAAPVALATPACARSSPGAERRRQDAGTALILGWRKPNSEEL